jgi:hypothetical protein
VVAGFLIDFIMKMCSSCWQQIVGEYVQKSFEIKREDDEADKKG